jgi:hypothetical protein
MDWMKRGIVDALLANNVQLEPPMLLRILCSLLQEMPWYYLGSLKGLIQLY